MPAIILSIGDELILGQTVDTNSAWLSGQLAGIGIAVHSHITVGDDQRAIEDAMREAAQRCELLICTGGIGPTPDDLTRQALSAVMSVPLVLNETALAEIKRFFKERGRQMPEMNKIQAMIPRGAAVIFNSCGTAAGIDAYINDNCRVVVMPGVPNEMKTMFSLSVLPTLKASTSGEVILSRTLHTFGLGESAIAQMLGDLMDRNRNPLVGTTVANGIVSVRLNSRFESPQRAADELARTAAACREKLGDLIFAQDEQTLPDAVAELLKQSKTTVTTAESCTGGLLAKMLTDVPGSSEYFKVGFVTYSNQSKYERLGVPTELINVHGAVSEPVVAAMAKNARRLAKADYAMAISGVAGPTGGTPAKPVGTVCIALASPPLPPARDKQSRNGEGRGGGAPANQEPQILVRTFAFPGDRAWVRDRAAKIALTILRFHLLGKKLPF